jgi:uncharacterized membrane protein YhhN
MTRKETLIYFCLGAINVISGLANIEWLNHLSKPLLTLSLAYFYFHKQKSNLALTDSVMLVALVLSCLGDCFLMFDSQTTPYFMFGLGSFLLAHVCYIFVFSRQSKFSATKIAPFVIYAGFILSFLFGKISSELKMPVLAYMSIITLMGIMAVSRQTIKSYQTVLLGAIMFIVSDSLIGINKFAVPIPFASVWIMITYILAQYLIVEGVLVEKKS